METYDACPLTHRLLIALIDWTRPTVLVLGNEGTGIHPNIKNLCTTFVTLPHSEVVESLNVASAAVPLLLERRRAKMNSVIHRKP